jgi:hypothetical protein
VRPRTLLTVALFLVFVADRGTPYAEEWFAPFGWASTIMLEALPWKLRGFDHISLYCLFVAGKRAGARAGQTPAMRKAL